MFEGQKLTVGNETSELRDNPAQEREIRAPSNVRCIRDEDVALLDLMGIIERQYHACGRNHRSLRHRGSRHPTRSLCLIRDAGGVDLREKTIPISLFIDEQSEKFFIKVATDSEDQAVGA